MVEIGPKPAHNLCAHGAVTNMHEGWVIGNGDLAAIVVFAADVLTFHLGKHDIFDARFPDVMADHVLPQDELIRLQREHGFRWPGDAGAHAAKPTWDRQPEDVRVFSHSPAFDREGAPCPKPAGQLRLWLAGSSASEIRAELDIATGKLTCEYTFPLVAGRLVVEAVVDRSRNVLHVRASARGVVPAIVLELVKPPDRVDADLPAPSVMVHAQQSNCAHIVQTIPAGCGVPVFHWSLAGVLRSKGDEANPQWTPRAYAVERTQQLNDGMAVACAVSVTTSREPGDEPAQRSQDHAMTAARDGFDHTAGTTAASWSDFWRTSGIALADDELEAQWHRNLFALGCHLRGDAPGMALCANIPTADRSPWHGVYTVNMNIQKMYLASLPTGHVAWIDSYATWLRTMEPSFAHAAELIFGFRDVVYSQHMLLPYVPAHRQPTSLTAGRSLGMTPWHGQPLWWRWRVTRDDRWLRDHAYWYLRKAADFCAMYLDKYVGPDGVIGPSMNLESPGFLQDFAGNRNCIVDLIMFRHGLTWAIEAATALAIDEDRRTRWASARERVPTIAHGWDERGRGWIAVDQRDHHRRPDRPLDGAAHGQAMWAAWTCFPGEYVDGDEPDGLAAVLRDVIQHMDPSERHPDFTWVHLWWCAIPGLRLRLPGAWEHAREIILRERWPSGQAKTTAWIGLLPHSWRAPEDNYLGVVGTTEMLLQSQGEIIRLLPCWPLDKAAAFRGLRARGGVIVDACWEPRTRQLTTSLRVLADGPCHLRLPHVPARVQLRSGSSSLDHQTIGADVTFEARREHAYELQVQC